MTIGPRLGSGRRRLARAAVATAAGAVAAAPFLLAAPARAVSGIESGYWFSAQASGGVLPPPPTVPAKGLWVSSNPSGPQAISAVRFSLAEGESTPVLTLKVHQSTGTLALLACPTTSSWKAGDAQASSEQPKYDCSGAHAAAVISSDSTTVTLDLTGVVTSSVADLALVPDAPSGTPAVSPTFDITFEPVTADQVRVTQSAVAAPASGPDTSSTPVFDTPTTVGGAFSPPLATSAPADVAAAPFTPPTTAVPAPTVPKLAVAPIRRAVPAAAHHTSRRTRVIEGLALLGVLAFAAPSAGSQREGGRPRITLYDTPSQPDVEPARVGKAPAIR